MNRLDTILKMLPMLLLASATSLFASGTHSGNAVSGGEAPLTVSLITCWPGTEVYELCGHEAIRVRGDGIDSVWNYGTFDFTAKFPLPVRKRGD